MSLTFDKKFAVSIHIVLTEERKEKIVLNRHCHWTLGVYL